MWLMNINDLYRGESELDSECQGPWGQELWHFWFAKPWMLMDLEFHKLWKQLKFRCTCWGISSSVISSSTGDITCSQLGHFITASLWSWVCHGALVCPISPSCYCPWPMSNPGPRIAKYTLDTPRNSSELLLTTCFKDQRHDISPAILHDISPSSHYKWPIEIDDLPIIYSPAAFPASFRPHRSWCCTPTNRSSCSARNPRHLPEHLPGHRWCGKPMGAQCWVLRWLELAGELWKKYV